MVRVAWAAETAAMYRALVRGAAAVGWAAAAGATAVGGASSRGGRRAQVGGAPGPGVQVDAPAPTVGLRGRRVRGAGGVGGAGWLQAVES